MNKFVIDLNKNFNEFDNMMVKAFIYSKELFNILKSTGEDVHKVLFESHVDGELEVYSTTVSVYGEWFTNILETIILYTEDGMLKADYSKSIDDDCGEYTNILELEGIEKFIYDFDKNDWLFDLGASQVYASDILDEPLETALLFNNKEF